MMKTIFAVLAIIAVVGIASMNTETAQAVNPKFWSYVGDPDIFNKGDDRCNVAWYNILDQSNDNCGRCKGMAVNNGFQINQMYCTPQAEEHCAEAGLNNPCYCSLHPEDC